jgi:TPR repeat protein
VIRKYVAALWLVAAVTGAALAQEKVNIDDLKVRSEAGDKGATRALAEAYYLGRGGVEQDFPEAARWYRRLATQGDARAQTSLGLMYARGLGFTQNMAEARRWWSLAAAQNDAGAQHNLGMVYLEGQGVAKDLPQALHWFQRAAASGHVIAQRIAGLMLYEGEGVPRDQVTVVRRSPWPRG